MFYKKFLVVISAVLLLTSCSSSDKTPDLSSKEIAEIIKSSGEFPSMIEFDADKEMLDFYKINSDDVEESYSLRQMMAVDVNEIAVFKAKKGKTKDINEKLSAHINYLKEKSAYYPEQLESVNGAKVSSRGDCVYLVVHKNGEKIISDAEKKFSEN